MGGRTGQPTQKPSGDAQDAQSRDARDDDRCPRSLHASVAGPVQGIAQGTWLDVQLDTTSAPARAILVDPVSEQVVGALQGVPNLGLLLRCLEAGVLYRAYVSAVVGGRIDLMLARQ